MAVRMLTAAARSAPRRLVASSLRPRGSCHSLAPWATRLRRPAVDNSCVIGRRTVRAASTGRDQQEQSSAVGAPLRIPTVDVSPFVEAQLRGDSGGHSPSEAEAEAASAIYSAFSTWGVCAVTGHGIPAHKCAALFRETRRFFALEAPEREALAVENGGAAWRGWIPIAGELTHGGIDVKEGLYVGHEHAPDHPRVKAGTPLFGPNQWPASLPALKPTVLQYLDDVTSLGHAVSAGVSLALGLPRDAIHRALTADPVVLFRLFRYPPTTAVAHEASDREDEQGGWGIGEHTDYGFLTLLLADSPGLQFLAEGPAVAGAADESVWVDAPCASLDGADRHDREGAIVVNVGDLLERLTDGRFRSPRHRVRNAGASDRHAFPCFFDPGWDARVRPLPVSHLPPPGSKREELEARWERTAFRELSGAPYSAYLAKKVAKVFPDLPGEVGEFGDARGPSTRFNVAVPL